MTTITCEQFATSLQEKSAEIERIQQEHYDAIRASVRDLLAKVPKWTLIRLVGYTPGFNDGDPCTHSTYVEVDGDAEEQPDGFDDGVFDDSYQGLNSTDEETLISGITSASAAYESVHDTNFQIWFTRLEDGTVGETYAEYDCGW